MTFELPHIRLDLEHMRYSVIHALGVHNREIEKYVSDELARQIEAFDYEASLKRYVDAAIERAVKQSVEDFFLSGGGSATVYEAVKQQLTKANAAPKKNRSK